MVEEKNIWHIQGKRERERRDSGAIMTTAASLLLSPRFNSKWPAAIISHEIAIIFETGFRKYSTAWMKC